MKSFFKIIFFVLLCISIISCMDILTEAEYLEQKIPGKRYSIEYSYSAFDNNTTLYFSNNKELICISILSDEQIILRKFTNSISFIDYINNMVYVSEGKNIWSYNTEKKLFKLIYTTSSNINGFYLLENYLIVNDNSGAWSTNYLIRISDSTICDSEEWQVFSKSYVCYGINSRVYHYRDGFYPDDICYNDIDTSSETFSGHGDSPYHGDYSLGSPIKISPDESILFTSSGNIFSAVNMNYICATNIKYIDLCFYNSGIYIISNDKRLLVYENGQSFTLRKIIKTYSETPVEIYVGNDILYVILVTSNNRIRIDKVSLFS